MDEVASSKFAKEVFGIKYRMESCEYDKAKCVEYIIVEKAESAEQ